MSQTTRELITLQVGHYANFVGTHWWNLQEASFVYSTTEHTDINHDFLFREGITSQRQETYTPRLLAIDLTGNLHSLAVEGTLYNDLRAEPSTSEAAWDGQVELIKQLSQEKNEFLKDLAQEDAKFRGVQDEDKDICIDDSKASDSDVSSTKKIYDLTTAVEVWSDFLCPHLHPKSIYSFDNIVTMGGRASAGTTEHFWGFPCGYSVFQREIVEEEVTDRIRCLAESCNSLQGFQLLSDVHNGMGGMSCAILQHLADEYGSKDSITFATSPPHLIPPTESAKLLMQTSIIQSYGEMYQLSSMLVPLNMRTSILDFKAPFVPYQHLVLKEYNDYVTSSVLAAFLDTASLVYRTRTSPMSFANVVDILTPVGRKVVGGSLSLPLGLKSGQSFLEWLNQSQESCSFSVSAGCNNNLEPLSEVIGLRGIAPSRVNRFDTNQSSSVQAAQLYHESLQGSCKPPNIRYVAGAEDPLKTSAPFPNIFSPSVTDDGYISTHNNATITGVRSVPCLAGLHQNRGLGNLLQQLLKSAKKINVMSIPFLLEAGVEKESWTSLTEDLQEIVDNYCGSEENTLS